MLHLCQAFEELKDYKRNKYTESSSYEWICGAVFFSQYNIPVLLGFVVDRKLLIFRKSRVSFPVTQLDPQFIRLLTRQFGDKLVPQPEFTRRFSKPLKSKQRNVTKSCRVPEELRLQSDRWPVRGNTFIFNYIGGFFYSLELQYLIIRYKQSLYCGPKKCSIMIFW